MKKINAIIFLLTLILIPSLVFAAPKYKIGAIMALSGELAPYCKAAQNGMLMALDALPAEQKDLIELKFEDDAYRPTSTVSAFHKLVNIDKVNALICWSSLTCSAIASLAEKAKIPLLAIASDLKISEAKNYVFNFWVTPEELTKILIPEAKKRGYRKIAIVSTTQSGSLAERDQFLLDAGTDFEIVYNQDFPAEQKDFRTTVTKIANLKPDAVLMIFMPGQSGIFAKQAREGGLKAPFFGYESLEDGNDIKASNGALAGAWFSTASSGTQHFVSSYKSRFPDDSNVSACNGYDAVALLASVSSKDSSADSVVAELLAVKNFSGASGQLSATASRSFTLAAVLRVVEKDQVRDLK